MGKSAFVCVLLVSVLWKTALTEDKCAVGCKGSPSTPTFVNGHKYNYGVEGTVSIYLTGADKQETSVKVLGQASVSALGNCAYVLKLTNLLISGPDGKKYTKPTGLDKPVRFVLEDGQLAPELCAEDGDTRRSLNIKRAIITLLQSGQKSGSEVDIFGVCPTEATSSQEGGAILLHRTRDLSRCAYREHGRTGLAVFNSQAEVKNTQILQSNLNFESKLNNGVPEKVSAIEEHLYKPFSIGENGARAKVMTKLTLTGHAAGADTGNFKQVRSVIFENPSGTTLEQSNYDSALAAVKDTAKTLTSEASSKSAGTFAQLIRILRPTSKEDLLKVYNQVKGNKLEKRVFLDGLLRAGTGHSIEASIQLLKSKELSTLEQNLVFLSLGNARHVNDAAVKSAATLLDTPNIPKEVYLGVGALAGVFCKEHACHHIKNEGIAALSQKFAAKLGNCKPKGKVEEDYVVAVLKGIRSIRHLEDNVIDKLVQCANDNGVKARVRSAALDAFLADPCAAKLKKTGIDLMKNRQLDSEIRIKAYLAVIGCPCGKSANEIKTLLESEPVHQVGHFITTSLRHIRASTNPDKRLAKQHYGLISTPSKFNTDDRKYSFYREVSYNVDALGLGGSVEQTVIYSQDSFLPRSASYNLTAEIFGHSLNIFEVGGRQGNLDRVVEHFLGPKSFLRTDDPQALFDNIMKRISETDEKVKGKLRGRRNVKTDIDNFDKHIKAEAIPYDNELDMDIYVKLFGTDAVFLSLGDDKGFDFNRVLDQILTHVDAGMNQAKKFQQEIRAHLLFLDAEMAYATSTGLPLKLNLVGAATGRFELATSVDFRQMIRDPKNAKFDVKLIPSTDIEISGLFTVDGDAVSTGLKVVTNLHSSTGGHVIVKILENGQGFDLQIGLPIEKQEIITATNELIFVTAEKGQKAKETAIKVDIDKKEYSACFDQLSRVLGLTLCGDVSVPFSVSGPDAQASIQKFLAHYPLTGSSRIKMHLEKNDLKGYHIKGIFKRDQPEKKSFELLFEAEGAQNRRTSVSGELVNTANEKSLMLSVESPIKTLYGQLSLHTKPDEYAAVVKAKMDSDEYYGRAGFNVKGSADRKVFQPVLEYQMPGGHEKKSLKIDGQIVREIKGPETKYTLDGIKINMPNNEVVDVNGKIALQPSGFDSELKAQKGEHKMSLNAQVKGPDGKIEFQNTLNPYVNFKANVHSEIQKDNVHNDIEIFYGGDLTQNRIAVNQLFKYHKNSAEDFGLITTNKLAINAIPLEVSFGAEVDPKKVDAEFKGQYVDKKVDFDLEARSQIKKPGDYTVKFEAVVDDKGVEVFAKRDIVSADKSNLENYIVIKNIGKYELSGVVLHKMKPKDMNIGVNGHLKVSGGGKGEDIKFDIGAIENANSYSSHAKISRAKVDFLDFLLKLNRGANPSGQLKFVLKDAITANGQYKVTDADGKGNGMVIVDFKKAQRKIKADVKFVVKEPTYNADVDLFLNFEKDNADKFHLSTNTNDKDDDFYSKNKFDYSGKKFELNIESKGELEQGKLNAGVEVVLPNERCLSMKVDRELTKKDDLLNGHVQVLLSDALKRGGDASTITYKAKLTNTNYDKEIYNHEGQVAIKLRDGKNLESAFHFKHEPVGESFKLQYKSDITGNLIPKPASISIFSEYADKNIIDGFAKSRVKANYGDDVSMEWINNAESHLLEKGDKKYQEDNTITLRLPVDKFHDIKLVSNVLFLHPENKDVYLEYSLVNSLQVDSDAYKFDASGKLGKSNGFSKVKMVAPHQDPFSLDASYKSQLEGEKKTGGVELKATYSKGKTATIVVDATKQAHEYNLNIKANAPQAEKLKKIELNLNTKKPSPDSFSNSIIVDADGRVYKYDSSLVYSKSHPVIDLSYSSPSTTKPSRFFLKGSGLSSTQGKVDLKIENIRDLDLVASTEGSIQKEAVAIKVTANSQKLNLKNYVVDISSKDSGSGKRLEFQASNDNKNILSGSTSFISKEEGPKTIIEGSGSVKVAEEQKSATFKYIRTLLTEGSEQGVETFMNVAIGDRSYVAESRITNLEYKTSYVYCEEKKQCAHAELHSKIAVLKPGSFQHTVNVGLDLRKLGFAPEFGIQMNNEMSERRFPQYTLDVYMNKEDKKYHLHVYSQPEVGRFPQGITITLPTRVIAMESELSYPRDKALPFPIKGNIIMTLDKNKPQQQTSLRLLVDVTGQDKQHNAIAEFGFSHPKIGKEAKIKFRGALQQPSERSIKIDSGFTISHPSLGADRESKLQVEASPEHLKLRIETPVVKIIDLEGKISIKDKEQEAKLKFSLLQGKPVQVVAIAKDYQYFELSTSYSDEAQRKLSIIGHIDPEKRVDISADIILPKEKKNIIHGALYLQDNLVKSDYGASKDNYDYFVKALNTDIDHLKQRIEEIGKKATAEVKTALSKVEPTTKDLQKAYSDEIDALVSEFANDKVLKDLSRALNDIVEFTVGIVKSFIEITKPIVDGLHKIYVDGSKKILEMYETKIEPQVKELYKNIAAVVHEYTEGIIDILAHFTAVVTDFFEKHKAELQELTNTIAEIFKDLTKLAVAQLKEIRTIIVKTFEDLTQQIKELPIIAAIKEKIQELSVPEQVLGILAEAHNTIRNILPTEESKLFADAISSYVQKKLRQEKVDDATELRGIFDKMTVAFTSVLQLLKQQLNQFGVPSVINFNALPFLTGSVGSGPVFGAGIPSFSIINQLVQGDLPNPLELLRAYRPRSLNPLDEVPSKLRAVVVNGQHIFTFDGRHLTFPGTCRYVLAHDHVDRNFTIIMQLQNGAPKAILLEDKTGTTIELKDNGQVAVNGAAHGFPVLEKDTCAFRTPDDRLGVGTTYGAMVLCTPKLDVCYIDVNGFYLGKLRGLLGDGNNEPYDDFRLPNGKIVSNEAEFGNAYRLSSSCAQVKTPEHHAHQHHSTMPEECETVFGGSSTLRPLSLLLDIAPFRQACIHAVTGNKANALKEACDLGRGYAALAVSGLIPALMPPQCVTCKDIEGEKPLGATYEIKLPAKKADIIVTVETVKDGEKVYKELVVPLVSQIIDGLKGKHIEDIKVTLIGMSPKYPYPILYDSDLKLKSAKITFDDETRNPRTKAITSGLPTLDNFSETIANITEYIKNNLGLYNVEIAYKNLIKSLNMRADAVKHIISVTPEECGKELFRMDVIRKAILHLTSMNNGVTHTVVTTNTHSAIGSGQDKNHVIGFDDETVLMLGDKKRGKDSEALRQTLQTSDNACFVDELTDLVLSISSFNALNPGQQKQYVHSAAGAIADRMTKDQLVQKCTCAYKDTFFGHTMCVVEDRKESARRRK